MGALRKPQWPMSPPPSLPPEGGGANPKAQRKKAGNAGPWKCRQCPAYFTCLPIRPAISNIDTWPLPNSVRSLSSALTMRLFSASWSLFFLM